ncbi:MAG: hypothetical protein ACREGD_02735 [Candidatus Saccharimonadales bacterium]
MQDYATKKDVQEIVDKAVNRAVDDLSTIIRDFAFQVDERFDSLEKRVDRLEEKLGHLTETLDHFLKRLDDIEADNAARDAKLARLERWAEQVAKKTGVKIEY